MTKPTLPFAGYVRVSRVSGRSGDSFISPDVQRETIQRLARAHDLELAEIVEELDVSGGRKIEQRELGRLVEKIKEGEFGGVIVWKLSRFSRSMADSIMTADRITKAGGRLITGDDVDTGTKSGRLMLGIMSALAEDELDARREGWRDAQERAAKRGKFPGKAPLGYNKIEKGQPDEGHLVPDPILGPVVRELFAMRAKGASLSEASAYLEKATGRRASRAALSNLFRNRTYLGQTVLGDIFEPDTHEPLTDERTWSLAQRSGTRARRDGSLASQGVLAGTVRCAGCGGVMSVTASGPKGKRVASYSCRGKRVGGDCPAPASILVDKLDALVTPQIEDYKQREDGSLRDMLNETEAVAFAMGEARKELDAYLTAVSVAEVGKEAFLAGLSARRDKVEQLEAEWQSAETRADALLDVAEGENAELAHDRAIARTLLDSVTVSKTPTKDGKLQRGTPIEDRVEVVWK